MSTVGNHKWNSDMYGIREDECTFIGVGGQEFRLDHQEAIIERILRKSIYIDSDLPVSGSLRGRIPNRLKQRVAGVRHEPSYVGGEVAGGTSATLMSETDYNQMRSLYPETHLYEEVNPWLPLVFYQNDTGQFDLHVGYTVQWICAMQREDELPLHFPTEKPWMSRSLLSFLQATKAVWGGTVSMEHFTTRADFNEWATGCPDTLFLMEVVPLRIENDQEYVPHTRTPIRTLKMSPWMPFHEMGKCDDRVGQRERLLCPWKVSEFHTLMLAEGSIESNDIFLPAWTEEYHLRSTRADLFANGVPNHEHWSEAHFEDYNAEYHGQICLATKVRFIPGEDDSGVYYATLSSASSCWYVHEYDMRKYEGLMFGANDWPNDKYTIGPSSHVVDHVVSSEHGDIVWSGPYYQQYTTHGAVARVVVDSHNYYSTTPEEMRELNTTATSDGIGEAERGESSMYVQAWEDNRGRKIVDLAGALLEPCFWHEFIRCTDCNGEVEIRIPMRLPDATCKCPHCGSEDGIKWPHCKVPTPLKGSE